MFTDWTQTDPHYFYLRGAIMGCVLTLMVVMPIINELRKRLRRAAVCDPAASFLVPLVVIACVTCF